MQSSYADLDLVLGDIGIENCRTGTIGHIDSMAAPTSLQLPIPAFPLPESSLLEGPPGIVDYCVAGCQLLTTTVQDEEYAPILRRPKLQPS